MSTEYAGAVGGGSAGDGRSVAGGSRAHDMLIDHAADLEEAEAIAAAGGYDAVVLDRQLPDGDGLSLVPELRASGSTVPVVVLAARGELADRVAGLGSGADDYLGKPFAFEELLARLRALLRRRRTCSSMSRRSAACRSTSRIARPAVDGPVAGECRGVNGWCWRHCCIGWDAWCSAPHWMEAVYGLDDDVQPNALDTHVSRLRRRLTEADAGVTINGVRGLGYVLRETP